MSSDMLGISVTGLRVAQSALSTVGHNIANAGVDGYSRQKVNAQTNPTTLQGGQYVGNGANIESIERQVNEFLTRQLRDDTTLHSGLNVYYDNIRQLDTLLADEASGLSSAFESFFASMQNGADDPTSVPARQLIVSESENLAARFNTIYDRFEIINNSINASLESAVSEVNALVSNLAELNDKISEALGVSGGAQPNDLLDQRDETLKELAKYIGVQTYEQGFGHVNVVVGSGQNLVIGANSRSLDLVASEENSGEMELVFVGEQLNQSISNVQVGGEIGGLIRFRDEALSDVYNQLGQIAIAMAGSFNEAHSQGVNLNNEYGGNFFYDVNDIDTARDRVIGNSDNARPQDRVIRLDIADISALTISDYAMEIGHGGTYSITRESDGAEVANGILTNVYPTTVSFDGLDLVMESGSFQAGDKFSIQPTRTAARDFYSALVSPEDIAFGLPIISEASISNLGSGAISSGEVLSREDASGNTLPLLASSSAMDPPLVIRFTSATTYDVLDNSDPGNPVQLDPPLRNQRYFVGMQNDIFSTDLGETQVTTAGDFIGLPAGRTPLVGAGTVNNGYPQEVIQITSNGSTTSLTTPLNASAREIASLLNNLDGVNANASTYMEISNTAGLTAASPLQITLNGEDLVEYEFDSGSATFVVASNVPDPTTDEDAFNDYIASRINDNANLSASGVYAVAGTNPVSGNAEIRVTASQGEDLDISLEADAGGPDSFDISDGTNAAVTLDGNGAGVPSTIAVGGSIDIRLADGVSLGTQPRDSLLFGDTTATDFAKSAYLGIQTTLSGVPQTGDEFTIDINLDAAGDNRNAINIVNLEKAGIIGGGVSTYSERYAALVQDVGITTASAQTNRDAADRVLKQSEELRNSISGVNLDEEAADLIRFEQMYSANTQVISVARDLFDRLISSF